MAPNSIFSPCLIRLCQVKTPVKKVCLKMKIVGRTHSNLPLIILTFINTFLTLFNYKLYIFYKKIDFLIHFSNII